VTGSIPTPLPYKPGEIVTGEPNPARLPSGCYFVTDAGCGSGGGMGPCVVTTRVVCDGGLIIHGRKVPTWALAAAAAVAALVIFRE